MSSSWLLLGFCLPLLSIVIERYLNSGLSNQPSDIFRWLAKSVSAKVVNPNNGPRQQRIAGLLATLVLITPIVMVISLFHLLNPLSQALDALLLVFLLQWRAPMQRFKHVNHYLDDHQKARFLLAPWLLRDCNKLTQVGVAKANSEMITLRLAGSWFGVLFWFMLGGIVPALLYRLVYELHLSWNPKQAQFRQFGQASNKLYQLLSWLPFKLLAYMIAIFSRKHKIAPALSQGFRWPYTASGTLLSIMAAKLEIELGGPRLYQQQRHEQAYYGPKKQYPTSQILAKQARLLEIMSCVMILLLLPIYALRYVALL